MKKAPHDIELLSLSLTCLIYYQTFSKMLKLVGLTNCRKVSVELDIYTSEVVTALGSRFYQNDSFSSDVIGTLSNFADRVSRFNTGLRLDRGLSVARYTRARKMLQCIDGRLSIFRRQ